MRPVGAAAAVQAQRAALHLDVAAVHRRRVDIGDTRAIVGRDHARIDQRPATRPDNGKVPAASAREQRRACFIREDRAETKVAVQRQHPAIQIDARPIVDLPEFQGSARNHQVTALIHQSAGDVGAGEVEHLRRISEVDDRDVACSRKSVAAPPRRARPVPGRIAEPGNSGHRNRRGHRYRLGRKGRTVAAAVAARRVQD